MLSCSLSYVKTTDCHLTEPLIGTIVGPQKTSWTLGALIEFPGSKVKSDLELIFPVESVHTQSFL